MAYNERESFNGKLNIAHKVNVRKCVNKLVAMKEILQQERIYTSS